MNRIAAGRVPHGETAACRTASMRAHAPIEEGLSGRCEAPKRKYRSWMNMGDDELLSVASRTARENGLTGRKMLREFDSGLASRLSARGLWARVEYGAKDGAKHETEKRPKPENRPEHGTGNSPKPGNALEPLKPGGQEYCADEIVFLAQSAIQDGGLSCMDELAIIDPELHGAVVGAGAEARLVFPVMIEMPAIADDDCQSAGLCEALGGRNGRGDNGNGSGFRESAGRDEKARAIDEEAMYRMICRECFRVGGASPFVGGCRTTIPKLQSAMHRKLGGHEHKLFRKCWDRMAAEGAIAFNSNSTAASLNPHADVRDGKLRSALEWAAGEQRRP